MTTWCICADFCVITPSVSGDTEGFLTESPTHLKALCPKNPIPHELYHPSLEYKVPLSCLFANRLTKYIGIKHVVDGCPLHGYPAMTSHAMSTLLRSLKRQVPATRRQHTSFLFGSRQCGHFQHDTSALGAVPFYTTPHGLPYSMLQTVSHAYRRTS